jgi:hypothetical protein
MWITGKREIMIEIAPHIIKEAEVLAAELVKNKRQTIALRSTGLFVTVDPENKVAIHEFKYENIYCYITMGT